MLNNGCYACSEVQAKWLLQNYYTSVLCAVQYFLLCCGHIVVSSVNVNTNTSQLVHSWKTVECLQPPCKQNHCICSMWMCKSAYSLQTRVRIHSECPVENYGTSTVFTPSYLSSLSNLNADNNAVVVPIALQEMQHLVGGGGNIAICSSSWVSLSPLESIKVFLDSPFHPLSHTPNFQPTIGVCMGCSLGCMVRFFKFKFWF